MGIHEGSERSTKETKGNTKRIPDIQKDEYEEAPREAHKSQGNQRKHEGDPRNLRPGGAVRSEKTLVTGSGLRVLHIHGEHPQGGNARNPPQASRHAGLPRLLIGMGRLADRSATQAFGCGTHSFEPSAFEFRV